MKKYLITSREFYTDTPAVFRGILQEQFVKHMPDFALYRDKSNPHYNIQADHFVEVCKNFMGLKSFLHQEYELAASLGANGVHLTSKQFNKIQNAKSLGLEVIISTHTKEEVHQAQKLGADYVTYSPIFTTPGKGEPKGVEDLEELVKSVDIKVFALGGIIDEKQIDAIKSSGVYGFASIRYFY
jgi:thiamine-phosphate pyrophosphorylase